MIVKRGSLILVSILFLLFFALYGTLYVCFLGPSPSVRDRLTLSLLESSAAKFVPRLFMPSRQVDEIIALNSVIETTSTTDTSLIAVFAPQPESAAAGADQEPGDEGNVEENDEWADYPGGVRIEHVKGGTYRAYVMLIRDPSRVYVATSSDFQSGKPGLKILDAVKKEGAIAAVNGGGFPDVNGVGLGDVPLGLVFSKGEILWGDESKVYSSVIGFDSNNALIVGSFSAKTAKEIGMRDALCFGPTLIVNGEPAQVMGLGGGLNPRSAIGQRGDGTVILLCVDGRMPSSMGASFSDLIEIMLDYGAVNASNLDGGMSATLVYEGELVNICSSLYGPRRIPTFFMVREQGYEG